MSDSYIAALIERAQCSGDYQRGTLFSEVVDALAALSAEPTEAMKEAGYGCVPTWPDDAPPIQIVWRAMYDAALAERGKDQSDSGDDNAGAKKAAMANNVLASRAACEDSPVSDPTPAPAVIGRCLFVNSGLPCTTPPSPTPEAQSGLVKEINASLSLRPSDKLCSDRLHDWKLLQRARDRIATLESELARAKPVLDAAREAQKYYVPTDNCECVRCTLSAAIRAYDKERE